MNADERLLSFGDLKERGIVKNHAQLQALTKDHGFPPGIWLGVNTHRWTGTSVRDWLASRPTTSSAHVLKRAAASVAARRRLSTGEPSPPVQARAAKSATVRRRLRNGAAT